VPLPPVVAEPVDADRSGTFVENDLSREMSRRLRGNNLAFDPATARIEVDYLVYGCQDASVVETFVLQGSHLRLVEQQDRVRAKEEGCYLVTRRIQEGGLTEVSRRRAPELDRDPG
jgi:hypothetical protein